MFIRRASADGHGSVLAAVEPREQLGGIHDVFPVQENLEIRFPGGGIRTEGHGEVEPSSVNDVLPNGEGLARFSRSPGSKRAVPVVNKLEAAERTRLSKAVNSGGRPQGGQIQPHAHRLRRNVAVPARHRRPVRIGSR